MMKISILAFSLFGCGRKIKLLSGEVVVPTL